MSKSALALAQAVIAVLLVQGGVAALRPAPRPTGMHDEGLGRVTAIEVHFVPSAEFVRDTYLDFFRQLPADVRIYVAVERREHADEFTRLTGRPATPVVIGRPITTWSRDRFAAGSGGIAIPSDVHAGGAERRNDRLVPFELAKTLRVSARVAPFRFDGGDFLAIGGRIVATSTWTNRTPERPATELVTEAERFFGMPMVYLPDAPDHHVGMAFAPIGANEVLVGDMKWGRRLAPEIPVNEAEEARFDAMADGFVRAGFVVRRIPAIATDVDFRWITYTNGIHENKVVYMPVFEIDTLDAAAREVYRGLGYDVRPVRVSKTYGLGGTLHCLVHVVERG